MLMKSVLRQLLRLGHTRPYALPRPGLPFCSAATTASPEGATCPVAAVSTPNVDEVATALGLDDDGKQQLHLLMLEYSELQLSAGRAPDRVPLAEWRELMMIPSMSGRRKYHGFLFKKEKARQADRLAREQRRAEYEEQKRREEEQEEEAVRAGQPQHIKYGLGFNSILQRISGSTLQAWRDRRLYTAMKFGQPLVFDLGFEADMRRRENKNTASQLLGAFMRNRASRDPFDLHFCSWNHGGEISHFLRKLVPTVESPSFPLHLHPQDYLSLFPRDRLVYLTPHCRQELETYDHDAIYIVGALVDLGDSKPLSMAKAKRMKLKMARLPITKYLNVGPGFDPSLTLTAMMGILLELRTSGCWERALKHVPQRSLISQDELAEIAARRSLKKTREEAALVRRQQRWQRESTQSSKPWWRDESLNSDRCADPYMERRRGREKRPRNQDTAEPDKSQGSENRQNVSSRLSEILSELAAESVTQDDRKRVPEGDSVSGNQARLNGGSLSERAADEELTQGQSLGVRVADGELIRRRSAEDGPARNVALRATEQSYADDR